MYTNFSFHLDCIFEESVFQTMHCPSFVDCKDKAQNPTNSWRNTNLPAPALHKKGHFCVLNEGQVFLKNNISHSGASGEWVDFSTEGTKWSGKFFQMCFTGVPSPGNRRSLGVSAEKSAFFHVGVGLEAEALKIWPRRPIFKIWFLLFQTQFCDPS